jgi:hypothetical protein
VCHSEPVQPRPREQAVDDPPDPAIAGGGIVAEHGVVDARLLLAKHVESLPRTISITLPATGTATLVRALMDVVPGMLPSEALAVAARKPVAINVDRGELRAVLDTLAAHGLDATVTSAGGWEG